MTMTIGQPASRQLTLLSASDTAKAEVSAMSTVHALSKWWSETAAQYRALSPTQRERIKQIWKSWHGKSRHPVFLRVMIDNAKKQQQS